MNLLQSLQMTCVMRYTSIKQQQCFIGYRIGEYMVGVKGSRIIMTYELSCNIHMSVKLASTPPPSPQCSKWTFQTHIQATMDKIKSLPIRNVHHVGPCMSLHER